MYLGKVIPMIGLKFGSLLVLERVEDELLSNGHHAVKYKCRCDCGNIIVTRGTALRRGATRSCGCSRQKALLGKNVEDLTGQRFGRWTVLYKAESLRDKRNKVITRWHCICDCGNEKDVRAKALKEGLSKSCGCYKTNRLNKDLTGLKYGRWLVLGQGIDKYHSGRRFRTWTCICECGTIRDVVENALLTQKSTSCGCLRIENTKSSMTYEDLSGQHFGHWTVLFKLPSKQYPGGGYAQLWQCRCTCGVIKPVSQSLLKSGYSRSCGCVYMSNLEDNVKTYLEFNGIYFESQKTFSDLKGLGGSALRYDFYLEIKEKQILIECQGEQHYRPIDFFGGEETFFIRTKHDRLKKDYAIANGMTLLEIPYTYKNYDKIKEFLDEQLSKL